MSETNGFGRHSVDPRGMHVLAEVAQWAQEAACHQRRVFAEQPTDRCVLETHLRGAVRVQSHFQFALEQYVIVVQCVEDRVEARLHEGAGASPRCDEIRESVSREMIRGASRGASRVRRARIDCRLGFARGALRVRGLPRQ